MSKVLNLTKTANECTLCTYNNRIITIQTTNKFGTHISTNLNKEQAIKLRDYLNEFIGDNNE